MELRAPVVRDSWVAKIFLPVRFVTIDLELRSVSSAPNFEPIPCTDAVSVWRQCRRGEDHGDVQGEVFELRRIAYRRMGMAVLNASKLALLQRDLLFKVGPLLPCRPCER